MSGDETFVHRFECRRRRFLLLRIFGIASLVTTSAIVARAQDDVAFHELGTKYIFGGFTVGSSIDAEGERALEPETKAGFGKRGGRYTTTQTTLEFEYTPTQYLQITGGPTISYFDIHGVSALDDRSMFGVNGFEADIRSIILDRGPSPFAVTASFEPEFHSLDETSGASVTNYGLETKLEVDTELVPHRLFLAFNALYEPETTFAAGMWQSESTIGGSSALAWQIIPNVAIGGDLWYLRHYEGLTFNSFTGDAVYLGPTFYWRITPKVLISAAWETQVAGHEIGPMPLTLDLTDFSRQRAHLLFEFEF